MNNTSVSSAKSKEVAPKVNSSRIGRKPIAIPSGVELKVQGENLSVKGPKGTILIPMHTFVNIEIADGFVNVSPNAEKRKNITGVNIKLFRSIAGTVRANIANGIFGVSTGFERRLTLVGVGYRAQTKGTTVALSLGFSHPTNYDIPTGITVETPSQTEIIVKGASKELVGQVASQIRAIRPPEPYKGKGARYSGEKVVIKETKKK
jgi:large subunit ribosomal protein L6